MLKILLTNDDGVFAPGIMAAKRALEEMEEVEVTIIAPSRPRSGCGHSITLHKALRAEKVTLADGTSGYSCSGTPSDCVVLGVSHLLTDCDIVISGINNGPNIGEDLTYSGTVGAAMEGAICGLPAIAISLDTFTNEDFSVAGKYLKRITRFLLENPLPHDNFLNVNVPAVPAEEIKGIKFTEQGTRKYEERTEKRHDPRGGEYFWICGNVIQTGQDSDDSDYEAVKDNYVSVTPISLNLTNFELKAKFEGKL